ncbi:LRR receptor [Vigna angularis]|uniref:LRR receptor n=1 Tax=Phaseolus angularis TaxID=3914 RepID=A0A8T0KQE0_PHAAN|nr:LRR receptor [Vigna angularis]
MAVTPFVSLSFLFLFLHYPLLSLSTNPEGNALHALRSRLSDPNNVLQSWDPTLVNACTWFHVTCDSNNHVIRFDVSNNDLCGTIPVEGNFESFPMESFENNRFCGPELKGLVPYDFGC